MNDKPGETPKANPDSDQKAKGQPDRQKITLILQKAVEIVHKNPEAVMQRIARIIDKPPLNGMARLLSLLMAENAPETLLENEHVIRGQIWANTVLAIAMAKIKEREESE